MTPKELRREIEKLLFYQAKQTLASPDKRNKYEVLDAIMAKIKEHDESLATLTLIEGVQGLYESYLNDETFGKEDFEIVLEQLQQDLAKQQRRARL